MDPRPFPLFDRKPQSNEKSCLDLSPRPDVVLTTIGATAFPEDP
jgi:hypothetical protein